MRYLLLIGGEDDGSGRSSQDVCDENESVAWVEEMTRRGVLLSGELLRPPSDATTVRVRDGEVLLSDGPFAETKEQMGGFGVIECANLDEALEIAAAHPVARQGMIEVRPIWE
ncbi:YciI family protein [Actinophytocola glycyrrhizae]|uniref:YciI family protein n=1 Tax=Actinophytocola glycyrrhizae TaxID=2044873 RepID=A0ABV9RXV1_9PSEU